ncbi:hypothetical protein SAMN05216229_102229 [Geopseudomonas sagittaria]|uniref:DUF4304 domain-containing protein n=1 Tax=Geopseudomonas sagittaria TaxID=1135990 RepID=A0A1I5Q7Q2_9GAMM|nr:hypothetical protein [Pseudomonas sagittaria]SFP42323.1 hypothetical protein SAMN05216229_102229 [Pseudomonas sagittaria]
MPSPFQQLCAELTAVLTPALVAAGYRAPGIPFDRHTIRYEFKREALTGRETIAILFNRRRSAAFGVQLFIEPPQGLAELEARGGALLLGTLSPGRTLWPFPVRAFGENQSRLSRLWGRAAMTPAEAVRAFLALLPEVDAWWCQPASSRHIVTGTLRYPGRQGKA